MRAPRRVYILVGLLAALLAAGALLTQQRLASCAPIPLVRENLLPNPGLAAAQPGAALPDGWSAAAPGAQLRGPQIDGEGFDYTGDGRALQLIGIANYLETPPVPARAGQVYCAQARTLTDSERGSNTRLRMTFRWLDAQGQELARDQGAWQPSALWTAAAPPADWATLRGAFTAPPGAAALAIQIQPASDDRVYLDGLQVLAGGPSDPSPGAHVGQPPVTVLPWPDGRSGALSFSFDWETAMGGLVHSRSVDDPYGDLDPALRGMRMREGVTTTLRLFAPHGIRATYYANGYNFLLGNRERRTFLGDPTYAWARTEPPYAWRTDLWARTPWFGRDPYGTVASDPAWYFGDLVPALIAGGQDIQTHTFSHLYAGFASPEELRVDLEGWNAVAAERGVPPARSLAFPWSGSAGMSDASWAVLERAGVTVLTRTNRSQRQYQLVESGDVQCRPLPGRESILVCPDFYLTVRSAPQAIGLIDRAVERRGMIDLWAHTEEVTTPEQIAAWGQVVAYAAQLQASGELWIAPIVEIAERQRAIAAVRVQLVADEATPVGGIRLSAEPSPLVLEVANTGAQDLRGVTLQAPYPIGRLRIDGQAADAGRARGDLVILDLSAGQRVRLELWPVVVQ
jgi:peptidoglycan/xylan/chitin deacetylase (PgdA/CDA1 family)